MLLGLKSRENRKHEFFKRLRQNLAIDDPKQQDRLVNEFRTPDPWSLIRECIVTEEKIAEHDRLFKKASAIIKDQIPIQGRPNLPVAGWWLTRNLKHAVALFERVIEINPENWSAMWLIGKVYQRLDITKALAWFERSLSGQSVSAGCGPRSVYLCDGKWLSRRGDFLRPSCHTNSARQSWSTR